MVNVWLRMWYSATWLFLSSAYSFQTWRSLLSIIGSSCLGAGPFCSSFTSSVLICGFRMLPRLIVVLGREFSFTGIVFWTVTSFSGSTVEAGCSTTSCLTDSSLWAVGAAEIGASGVNSIFFLIQLRLLHWMNFWRPHEYEPSSSGPILLTGADSCCSYNWCHIDWRCLTTIAKEKVMTLPPGQDIFSWCYRAPPWDWWCVHPVRLINFSGAR